MPTVEEARAVFVKDYKERLKGLLEGLDVKHRPPADRIQKIVDTSADYLNIDDLLKRARLADGPELHLLWDPGRDLCIAKNMAIGAAILAAWVASGGTLIVGTAVAGIAINSTILAALIGGASAYAIAEKLC